MAIGKITKRAVDAVAIPPAGKRHHLWDDSVKGFGLMVTDRGARSYILQYRIGGRGNPTRRVTIGKHGSPWTPDTARNRASELLEQVRRKVDPYDASRAVAEAAKAEKESRAALAVVLSRLAFDTVADNFIAGYAKKSIKRWKEYEGVILRDLKPAFGSTPLPTLTAADISDLLDRIGERGSSTALRAYNVLRAIDAYALEKEKRHYKAAQSPLSDVQRPGTVAKRERHLTDDELLAVWHAAGGMGWPFLPIVRLLILTGQRLREVAHMQWRELDLKAATWLIPGERTKNGQSTLVPLSPEALAILADLPNIKNDRDLVFPSSSGTALSAFSKPKAKLDATIMAGMRERAIEAGNDPDTLELVDWRFHDLRRTLAVGCQRMGVPVEVTEEILNHRSGTRDGIVGVYQVYRFQDEKAEALKKWATRVASLSSRKTASVINLEERRA
ncbi:tyrosine-type recombinase/integrase [Sphingobium xenophagum]|uniref:tyrosine-type recombinase/integrase n=1 Tax=Sphingobium xenophagum TaxID=121428 RepID=UPI0002FC393B|nr:site-specific integrase [Sphingobium xenophagum]